MATADQYAAWIVQNQAKRGTPDFDTVAKAYEMAKSEETKPSAGFSLKDLALSFGQGVGGGTQAITDVAGAGNVVSKTLSGLQQSAGEAMTPERQAEILRRQELKKKAEGNTWEEVKATLGGFAEAPLQTLAQGAGSMVPMIAGTLLVPEAAIPAAISRITALGVSAGTAAKVATALPASTVGAIMGVGGQKGQDYETVKRELLEKKIPEAEAERLAQKAAEYSLQNLPRQLAGGAAGALEGALGVESLIGRAGRKVPEIKGPSQKLPEPSWAQAIGKNTLEEAVPEAIQSAVSNVGTNVALNQAGVPTDLGKGVLAGALHDALVGGVLGAGTSPLKMKELRQEYVQDEFKGQQEYQKKQLEEIAANQKKIKDELGMTQNPLGSFTPDELGADLTKIVEQHRTDTGKPALTSYSLDDVVDALPGKDKAADAASVNALIATKSGHAGEVYTPEQVIETAQAKNVETGTQGFSDFLSRTTGLSDPAQMSQPQLHAAVTALAKLPGFTSTQSLPEGLNATNYTPEQFTKAIDGLNAKMDEVGKDELSFKEVTKAIETATGLKGSAVNALLNDANRSGDIVTDNKKVSVPSRTMPTGYNVSEEIGPEQEQAKSYEVRRGDEILDEHTTKESADQQVESLNKLTAEEIKTTDEALKTEEAKISKAEKEVQRLILAGNRSTPEFKAAQDAYQQVTDEAFPRIAELKARKESYQTPLTVAPIGVTKVTPKSYVVRKGEGIKTVKQTREEAEQAIFEDLSDVDLQELAKKRSPALQKRVNTEIQRRAAMPAKPAPAAEATATTPEQQAKLDQLKQDLPAMLKKFGLGDVGLKIVNAIEGGADGSYEAKLIQIALGADKPIQTMRHEAIHALKELGFFTPQQWAALERQAKKEWVKKYLEDVPFTTDKGDIISRYEAYKTPGIASKQGLNDDQIIEEAIADAFGDWDSSKAPGGMLTALLNKMRNFFSALRSYLNGEGFQTYKDVFGKIEKGELKATAPAKEGEAKKSLPVTEEQRTYKLNVEREERKMARTASLTENENTAVTKDAERLGLSEDKVDEIVKTIIADKKRYPTSQGWADLKVIGIDSKLDDEGNPVAGSESPKYAPISYAYNVPPGSTKAPNKVDQVWLGKVTTKFQNLVEDLYKRAANGDVTAKNIIAHQTWYKNVATTLRQEYGGYGDTLADLLGATSPNTPVDTNWKFSIDAMRRFVRGDFNTEMAKFVKYLDSGKSPSKYPADEKIRQLSGKLYGMNSTNAMLALADTWRAIKPGQAPKARNFALNLIGQSNMATIDVWAARMLRRAADMVSGANFPRIPPPAEQGVSGTWNADATKVTGAFGFGADVMQKVSDNLAKKGINVAPPDLQAIAWFAEKELWTKKNWTNRAGEGGSFEENIESLPTERYIAGHSIQVGETEPETKEIKAVQKQLTNLLSKDKSVIAFRVQETSGLYGGTVEKSFDTEIVVEKGKFDPDPLVEALANISKENNQYDIFISKVVGPREDNLNARPGVEIYFKTKQDMNKIMPILKRFTSRGQDGFTLAVDPRLNDGTGQYMGVRLQYVPEISMRWDEGLQQKLLIPGQLERILNGKMQLLNNIVAEVSAMEGVAYAATAKYDTVVIGKENYDEYTHGRTAPRDQAAPEPVWFGQPVRDHVERAITRLRGDTGQVSAGNLPSVDETQGDRKLSLRQAPDTPEFKQWFKDSKIVTKPTVRFEDGEKIVEAGQPKVMYHGTAQDITEFRPKQAGAIFLTDDPEFAGGFSSDSKMWMAGHPDQFLTPEQLDKGVKQAIKIIRSEYGNDSLGKEMIASLASGKYADATPEAQLTLRTVYKYMLPSGPNIMPVYVSAQNPFDYKNPEHVAKVLRTIYPDPDIDFTNSAEESGLMSGSWKLIESKQFQDAIKELGFDSFYVAEAGRKNLAVYDSSQIKSATGNIGTYDKSSPDIRKSLRRVQDEVDSLPNGAAINASINRIAPGREQKGYIQRILEAFTPQSVDSLRQQFLNRYNQLGVYDRELAKTMGGAALLADSSAESAALMSDNAAAIAAMACGIEGKGGIPVFNKGFTTISSANGEKGVLEILMPLAKIGDPRIYQTYQFWAGSLRGSRLITETDKNGNIVPRDHTYTKDEIDYAKELLVKYPEFKQVQEDWIKYNNGLMKYAVSTGVLSPEKAAEFMKYSDYIPFYRQIDGETTVGPKLFQNISGVTPPKKLKGLKEGQEAPLADFLETIVRNTQSIIQSGMKNVAAQRAIDVATQLKMTNKRQDVSYAPGVVTVLEKGKPVSYDVADQLFVDAVKSLNLPELPFLSFFAAPANVLRNMVTKDPGFMMANLLRDSLSAWVTSGAKMTPIASTIHNFGKALGGTDPAYLALRNAGVIGGYEFAAGVENSGSILGKSLRRETGTQTGAEKALKPFTSLWRGLEKGTAASDAATRMAVYNSVMEQTGNEAEAIYRAMEVMNFNRKGNLAIVRILTAAVPFLNARMQGLDVFYRAAFGKMASADAAAIQKSFFIRGATLMSLSCMYWFLTHDDDEYLKQEQETRDNNWLFPSAGIRIPTPFEVGTLFKTIPERMLEYSFGNDTGKDLADSMKRALISTFAFNPIPQTILPFVEARTNYSFYTMRPIVGQGMEGVASEYQVAPGTSEIAKTVGKSIGASPIMVDHIIQGYTGSMGMYLVDLVDSILMGNDESPKPAKRFEQMPVIKRFALDKEAKGTVTSYYDLKNSVDEVVRTVNLMERTGNAEDMGDYVEKNAHLLGMRNYISSVEKQMKTLREAAIQIRSSDMTPEEKRDSLSAITQAQNSMTANIREIKKSIQP